MINKKNRPKNAHLCIPIIIQLDLNSCKIHPNLNRTFIKSFPRSDAIFKCQLLKCR